jgi:hypothetical protein
MPNYIKVLPNVEVGSLQIHRGIDQGLYSNQSSAEGYLVSAIDGTCSKVYLDVANDVLFFDVPQGTFTNPGFLNETSAYIVQLNDLLYYGNECFVENSGNNIIGLDGNDTYFGGDCFVASSGNNTFLGNCFAAENFFRNSTGNNTFKYIECDRRSFDYSTGNTIIEDGLFLNDSIFGDAISNVTINNIIDAGDNFGKNYQGNFIIKGNIGATNSADLTGTATFFDTGGSANLIVQLAKATSNGGGVEGDLRNAFTNGATVNYILI